MFEDEYDEFEEFDDEFEDDEFEEDVDDETAEELAMELLELEDDEELDEFFGSLLKSAARAAGGFLKSSVGRKLVGGAKRMARRALPKVGRAIGGHFGGRAGRDLGGAVGRFAATRFEVDEYELEAAKRVIKTTCSAAKKAVKAQNSAPPAAVAKKALAKAAKKHKPTAVPTRKAGLSANSRGGRWTRRGRKIVLVGA